MLPRTIGLHDTYVTLNTITYVTKRGRCSPSHKKEKGVKVLFRVTKIYFFLFNKKKILLSYDIMSYEFPIYLIGYMASGKTTIGKLLAQQLGCTFVDTDEAFTTWYELSPADFIRRHGEIDFRKHEKDLIERLSELPTQKVVYATGGGYPCWMDNMDCLLELGTSIYLRWKPEHLVERLLLTDLSKRPLLDGCTSKEVLLEHVRNHLRSRDPIYSRAHITIQAPIDGILHEHNDTDIVRLLVAKIRPY